jgi:site-specific DNA-methyltransferase (adenine-specific)
MIIPARWFAGGKGLDDFRSEMLNDKRIRKLVDYENSNDIFPGVDVAGGICYFLWDRDNAGLCEVTNFINGNIEKSERALNEFPIFIRHSKAIPIIRKVLAKKENGGKNLSSVVSPSKPFGIRGHHAPAKTGVPCYFTQRQGLLFVKKDELSDNYNLLDKYKLLIPRAPIAGQTDFSKPVGFYYDGNMRIAKPGEACTETYIVAFASKTQQEVLAFKSYLLTKLFRFLLLQTVVSQDVTRSNFIFIPDLGKYEGVYTDEMLCKRWGINKEEWAFIDSRIKDVAGNEPEDPGKEGSDE